MATGLDVFSPAPDPRLQTVLDPDTGYWKVTPEQTGPNLPVTGVTMDQVVYENESPVDGGGT